MSASSGPARQVSELGGSGNGAVGAQRPLHQAFEAHARATPDAPAALLDDRDVSYAELNAMANRLAHRLRATGVAEGEFVAICTRRSVETLAGILAVLKAGAAFVPLRPDDPDARLAAVIQDVGPRVLLAAAQDQSRFERVATLALDCAAGSAEESNLGVDVAAEQVACVYYTSGSSGDAKGVVFEHRSLVGRWSLSWYRELRAGRELVMPTVNGLTFFTSHKEFVLPWLLGEPVWVLDDRIAGDPVELLRALARRPRVVLGCVPQLWEAMLDAADGGLAPIPDTLEVITLGGEGPRRSLVDRSFAALPDLELWNGYGATESGHATSARLGPGEPIRIGQPVPGAEVQLLDEDLRPVAAGEPGRLYLGGPGLARGYFGRPDLTAERFVPHPAPERAGDRLFKTDDTARRHADGSLEFVSRSDRLIKIRGFRIDPVEVEEALDRHPGVARAAVTGNSDDRGRERLVAHVVPARDSAPALAELRDFLAWTLPDYMLPSRLATLDALPTTASGKVDRLTLRVPQAEPGGTQAAPVATRDTAVERVVAGLWEEVLGVARVEVGDDFFDLGGDSLSAVRVVARVHQATGVELSPSALLEAPTPERLAARIANLRGRDETSVLVAVRREGIARPFFWVAPRENSLTGVHRLAGHLDSRTPVYALYPNGREDWEPTVEAVATRYLAAVRTVQPDGPYLLGGHCFGSIMALELAQQLRASGQSVALLAILDPLRLRTRLETEPPADRRGLARRSAASRIRDAARALVPRRQPRSYALRLMRHYARNDYVADAYSGRITHYFSSERIGWSREFESGWRAIAGQGLENVLIAGQHLEILDEPAVAAVAEDLNQRLQAVEAETGPPSLVGANVLR